MNTSLMKKLLAVALALGALCNAAAAVEKDSAFWQLHFAMHTVTYIELCLPPEVADGYSNLKREWIGAVSVFPIEEQRAMADLIKEEVRTLGPSQFCKELDNAAKRYRNNR